jgi:hypothetical protein
MSEVFCICALVIMLPDRNNPLYGRLLDPRLYLPPKFGNKLELIVRFAVSPLVAILAKKVLNVEA